MLAVLCVCECKCLSILGLCVSASWLLVYLEHMFVHWAQCVRVCACVGLQAKYELSAHASQGIVLNFMELADNDIPLLSLSISAGAGDSSRQIQRLHVYIHGNILFYTHNTELEIFFFPNLYIQGGIKQAGFKYMFFHMTSSSVICCQEVNVQFIKILKVQFQYLSLRTAFRYMTSLSPRPDLWFSTNVQSSMVSLILLVFILCCL